MGTHDGGTFFSVHCPRCDAVLAFAAREGDAVACEECGQRLIIVDGSVAWDRAAPSQHRHDVACPRCDRLLAFFAADGDRFECAGCGLDLDVEGGLVTYDAAAAARSSASKRSTPSAPPGARRGAQLGARERDALRRVHAELASSLSPGDVRTALAQGELALERLRTSATREARDEARRLETLLQMLRDWWDEEASFDWVTAAQLAAALQAFETQDRSTASAAQRESFLVELCTDAVRPALEHWARERSVDLSARGF